MSETTVATVGKTPQHVTTGADWNPETGILCIKWSDNQETALNAAELPQPIRNDLMYHGLLARVRQSYTSAAGSPEKAREKATKLWDTLKAGEWGVERGERSYSVTVQALAALMSISLDAAETRFSALDKAKKIAIGKRPDVQLKIKELRAAESKPSTESLDAMLA